MSWIVKLLAIFQKESPAIILNYADLPTWLVALRSEILANSSMMVDVNIFSKKLNDKRWYLEAEVDAWMKMVPSDRREELQHLFRATRSFLDLLTVNGLNCDLIELIGLECEKLLRQVEASTFAENYAFIGGNELVNPLLRELFEIAALQKSIQQKINQSGMTVLNKLTKKSRMFDLYLKEIASERLKVELRKERLLVSEQKKEEKRQILLEFKKDAQYDATIKSQNHEKMIKRNNEDLKSNIEDIFSTLQPLLLKYGKENSSNLVESYIENPWSAFRSDESFSIIHVLRHLQALIANEKYPNELLPYIDDLCSGRLEKMYQQQAKIEREPAPVTGNIEYTMRLEDAQYRFDHYVKQVNILKMGIRRLEETTDSKLATMTKEKRLFEDLVRLTYQKKIQIV